MNAIFLFYIILLIQNGINSSNSYDFDSLENSDEDRFYIDESNWPVDQSINNNKQASRSLDSDLSTNTKLRENVTVKVGRQATLPCFIDNLGSHKVIWAKNGDILALGTTKINSDPRLIIQHRYVSEWHMVIDNVATEDEGEYICKTNGQFYKTIKLVVLMPPTMDDTNSIPAGTINLKESSSLTLKCHAYGNPTPTVKWYRWKKYKNLISQKTELTLDAPEILVKSIGRNDFNTYECIARNGVAPATSRLFNIEIHFLPMVNLVLNLKKRGGTKLVRLDCEINANPLERVVWYRNGERMLGEGYMFENEVVEGNWRVVSRDVSNVKGFYKTLVQLTIKAVGIEDFGEYQCCAMNAYGQVCSNTNVTPQSQLNSNSEIKTSTKLIHTLLWNTKKTIETIYNNDPISETTTMETSHRQRSYLTKDRQFLHLESSGCSKMRLRSTGVFLGCMQFLGCMFLYFGAA